MGWLNPKNEYWAWWQCPLCVHLRAMPVHWKFHTCELHDLQMAQINGTWTRKRRS